MYEDITPKSINIISKELSEKYMNFPKKLIKNTAIPQST